MTLQLRRLLMRTGAGQGPKPSFLCAPSFLFWGRPAVRQRVFTHWPNVNEAPERFKNAFLFPLFVRSMSGAGQQLKDAKGWFRLVLLMLVVLVEMWSKAPSAALHRSVVCVCAVWCGTLKNLVCRFKTPPCVHSKRPRVCQQHAHMHHHRRECSHIETCWISWRLNLWSCYKST